MRPPFFNRAWYAVVVCSCLPGTYPLPRPAYMNYGAFGMVAAHELTVSPLVSWNLIVLQLFTFTARIRLFWSPVQ